MKNAPTSKKVDKCATKGTNYNVLLVRLLPFVYLISFASSGLALKGGEEWT